MAIYIVGSDVHNTILPSGFYQSVAVADGFVGPINNNNPNSPTFNTAAFPFGITLGAAALVYESSTAGIVASATLTQAAATKLTSEVNWVQTAAVSGAGVALPAALAGLTVEVANLTANPITVYGNAAVGDTIDGVATATGVVQMQGSSVIYTCGVTGQWASNGIGNGYAGSIPTNSATSGITASATQTQAGATQLTTVFNRIDTNALANNAVKLLPGITGMQMTVYNNTANAAQVYASGTDTINGAAGSTGISLGAAKTGVFTCYVSGAWTGPITLA